MRPGHSYCQLVVLNWQFEFLTFSGTGQNGTLVLHNELDFLEFFSLPDLVGVSVKILILCRLILFLIFMQVQGKTAQKKWLESELLDRPLLLVPAVIYMNLYYNSHCVLE